MEDGILSLLGSLAPNSLLLPGMLLLLAGGAAIAWPLLAGSGRGDLKRRLKIEAPVVAEKPQGPPRRPTSAVREKALKTAQEFYAKSDPENVARLRLK
ncbi:MAG: type II secretion system F family protein, partial [Rhizobiaceae bacterium]